MELEEILKKYIEVKKLLENNELMVATGLIKLDDNKDSRAAVELLTKTTKADAEVLARATHIAADQLRRSNESSVK